MAVNLGQAVGYLELDTSRFTRPLGEARSQLAAFVDQSSSLSGKFSALVASLTSIGGALTKSVTTPIMGVGVAAVKMGSDFNAAMSQVAATMGKPTSAIEDLRAIAIKMGNDTKFSATEAAEGLNYLALAGYSSEQQIAALPKTLTLAAAGGMELGAASDMLTDAMSALGLASKNSNVLMGNMDTMLDQMAVTASKSNTSVAQLGDAILTVGGTAKGLSGFTVDAAHGTAELSTALGILADNGIKASEGGTALRNVLVNLNPTTEPAIKAFEKLGVSAYDSDGKMKPLKTTFGELQSALGKYSQQEQEALKVQMFGRQNLSAVNALLGTSSDRWDELTAAILDSNGAADEMAATMQDNLQGDLDKLNSAIGTTAITINDMLDKALRGIVQTMTNVVNAFNQADPATQKLIVGIAGIAAAIGPAVLIVGNLVKAFGAVISAGEAIVGAISAIGPAISGGFSGTVVAGFLSSLVQVSAAIGAIIAAVDAFRRAWDDNIGGIRENTKSIFENVGKIIYGLIDVVNGVLSAIVQAWDRDFGGIRTFVENVIAGIISAVAGMLNFVVGAASGIQQAWNSNFLGIQDIVSSAVKVIETVLRGIVDICNAVASAIGPVFDAAFQMVKTAVSALRRAWDSDFGGMRTIVEGAASGVKTILQGLLQFIQGVVKTITALFRGDWSVAFQAAKETVSNLWQNVGSLFSGGISVIKSAMPKIKSAVQEGFQSAKEKAIELTKAMQNSVKEGLGNLVSAAKEKMVEFAEKIKEGAQKAKDGTISLLKQLPGKVGELLGQVIGKAILFVSQFPVKAKEAGTKFVQNVVSFLQNLPGKIWGFLSQTISKATQFVSEFVAKAKEAGTKFLEFLRSGIQSAPAIMAEIGSKIVGAFNSIPGQMANIARNIVTGLANGLKNAASAAVSAAIDFAGGLVRGMKSALGIHSPSTVAEKEIGENLAQGVIDGVNKKKKKAKKTAEELATEMVSAAKKGMSSYKEIYDLSASDQAAYWKKIIDSTKAGTQGNLQAQAEYAKALKKIQSDQLKQESEFIKRKTLEWETYAAQYGDNAKLEAQYWKEVLSHVTQGTDDYLRVSKKYYQALEKQQKQQEKAEKEYFTKRKTKWDAWEAEHGENAEKEAKYWKKTLKHLTEGTNTYLQAYKKYQESLQKIDAERWQEAQDLMDLIQTYNDVSLAEQVNYWDQVRQQFTVGTEQRLTADKKYFETKKSYDEQLSQLDRQYADDQRAIYEQLSNDIESLTQKYVDAVQARQDAILGQFKLFDEYTTQTSVDGKTLTNNLRTQVDALGNWSDSLAQLEGRQILPTGLVDEIRTMGVDATAEIQALNELSNDELQQYADLWQQKIQLAKNQATKEMEGMLQEMEQQQDELIRTAQNKLSELDKTYRDNLVKLGVTGKAEGKKAGSDTQAGIQEGLQEGQSATQASLDNIISAFKSALNKIKDLSQKIQNQAEKAEKAANKAKAALSEARAAASAAASISASSQSASVSTRANGNHKSGLDYVPYDGYVAGLHKGERVLTASENEEYTNGVGRGFNMINNFYGTKPLDERETARQFKLAQKQIALNW